MVVCPNCSKQHTYDESHRLGSDNCFTCYHWLGIISANKNNDNNISIVIDGHHYQTGKRDVNSKNYNSYSGCGGRKFNIRMLSNGDTFFTHNLWHQGEIPEMFRDRLPNNAEFVNDHKWQKVGDTLCISSD